MKCFPSRWSYKNSWQLSGLCYRQDRICVLRQKTCIEIDKAYLKLKWSEQMMDVARETLALCRENALLIENGIKAGTVTAANMSKRLHRSERRKWKHCRLRWCIGWPGRISTGSGECSHLAGRRIVTRQNIEKHRNDINCQN